MLPVGHSKILSRRESSMKAYPKNELSFKNGMLIASDNEVVVIDPEIVDAANALETRFQQKMYLDKQPKGCPCPTLVGFERESEFDVKLFEAETPIIDKRAEESKAFMDELDLVSSTNVMNDMLMSMKQLIIFVNDDHVYDSNCPVHKFDTLYLGNPLEWTDDTIKNVVAFINDVDTDDDDEDEDSVSETNGESE